VAEAGVARGFGGLAGAGSVAVVGASARNLLARITFDNLRRWRFAGDVFGIHPRGEPVDGVPTYATYEEAGGPPDVALLAVGAGRLVEALGTATGAGVRRFVIPGAGANEGGREIEESLRAAAREADADVLGPNCMGFASLHTGLVPYVGTIDPDLPRGSVGLVSQSGSVCELFTTMPWRVGFSHVVSVGNELTVDLTEVLAFLVDDPATGAIGLFVEGVRRPDDFRTALRRAAEAGKTVVTLKVGRSETSRVGTVAHTGVLAGDARVFSGVLRDTGAVEAADLDEFQVLLEMLGKGLAREPGRVVYVGDSGGQANLFADLAADRGVGLPPPSDATCLALRARFPSLGDCDNPLDLWALGDPEQTYRDGVALLLEHEPHLLVLGLDKFLARGEPERVFVRAGVEGVAQAGSTVLMAYGGSDTADQRTLANCWERRVPVTRGAERTLSSLAALSRWRRWQGEATAEEREVTEPDRALLEDAPTSEHAAKRLLEAAGISVTRERHVATPEEAVAAAADIGFPVVAKVARGTHKTDSDGVRLDLWTEEAVASAADDLLQRSDGVLVAEQARGDLEVIVGAFVDRQFGPCGLIGLGGLWTETFGQATVVLGPGSPATVRRALEPHPWGRLLLTGARGRRFPVEAITETLLRLIALVAAGRGRLQVLEINPLVIAGDRVVAVDALAVPGGERGA
jgi:acetate---CoA ligase (ADP-forming)